jgi:cytochrome c peroxidase
MRTRLFASFLIAAAIGGCSSSSAKNSATADAGDVAPVLTDDERAALLALSPDSLPAAPADPTNKYADDPKAAAFGQKLFFEAGFSGQLLSTDNDGTQGTLGTATSTSGQTGRVGCYGCHVPDGGYSDTRSFQLQVSLGAAWGVRRAPSLLDVGQSKLIMWDGRRDSLFSQVFGPLETPVEENSSRLYMAEQLFLKYKTDYENIFGAMPALGDATSFPALAANVTGCIPTSDRTEPTPGMSKCAGPFHGSPGDQAEYDSMTPENQTAVTRVVVNAGKAIGAYERLLTCGASPFDAWMHGNSAAISNSAQRGAVLFIGKASCVKCHSGPFMSDEQFHNVGLSPVTVQQFIEDSSDQGAGSGIATLLADPLSSRGAFSDGTDGRDPPAVTSAMAGAFRTPKLRCVNMRPTFMHTGQLETLAKVIAFFNQGGAASGYPGTNEIHSLGLSSDESADLVNFLVALDGPGPAAALRAP